MPTATALRCFIAVLEEQSGGGKPVGGADTGQRIMARHRAPGLPLSSIEYPLPLPSTCHVLLHRVSNELRTLSQRAR